MVVDKPITVTSSQFDHILSVAQPLGTGQREAYAVDVATTLQGQPIGDGSVGRAVRQAFATHFIPPELPQGTIQLGGQRRAPEQAAQWYADRGGSWARRAPTQQAPVAPMAYWAACRLQPHRTALALQVLGLRGFETYCPRLRERRARQGRLHEVIKPLFVG
jgi:alkylation response protein AidB-like acyl-CoA dehydrogenase